MPAVQQIMPRTWYRNIIEQFMHSDQNHIEMNAHYAIN